MRGVRAVAAVGVAVAGVLGLAGPASAAGVTVGFGDGVPFPCHVTGTVVPTGIFWDGRLGWTEGGSVTGDGACQGGGQTVPITLTGSWGRFGAARDAVTGECPVAEFHLQFGSGEYLTWREVTGETT